MRRARAVGVLVLSAALLAPAAASAAPIPERTSLTGNRQQVGGPATANPLSLAEAPRPPRHPFMAPNDRSNIHDDAYQSDSADLPGPLGRTMARTSTFFLAECASVTFDSRGRIVTICVGLDRPKLKVLDPDTLAELASMDLPPRQSGAAGAFNDFSGGGYFYLDNRDRVVVPTSTRHLLVVGQGPGGFRVERDYDLSPLLTQGDKLIAVMPDWSGRIWVVSTRGVVVTVDPVSGRMRSTNLGSPISNSFAVDETGGVYIAADDALHRLDAAADGTPRRTWRQPYRNSGIRKPGQTQTGSGTTPTVMGRHHVAITDNADPMNVVIVKRAKRVRGPRTVCTQPVFQAGASATDNSLIGTARSVVVENNFGYGGVGATSGGSTTPGLARVDLAPGGKGCRVAWVSRERAPSVVPKLSLQNGLVYTYTKEPDRRTPPDDPWYLTALDFRTGRTVFKRLAGVGLGFNNNYAPVTIGPDGTAYVGVLGGLVALRDRPAPPRVARPAGPRPKLRLARRCSRGALKVRVRGSEADLVVRARFWARGRSRGRARTRRDGAEPFTFTVPRKAQRPGRRYRVKASARLYDGRLGRLSLRVRGCRR
ncbi:MAG TPA: hypothetical protein VEX39_13055 [Thermoleophilaceae bacterium]|nr:hypothetical protein [Thermoleophilaceae bacterium]